MRWWRRHFRFGADQIRRRRKTTAACLRSKVNSRSAAKEKNLTRRRSALAVHMLIEKDIHAKKELSMQRRRLFVCAVYYRWAEIQICCMVKSSFAWIGTAILGDSAHTSDAIWLLSELIGFGKSLPSIFWFILSMKMLHVISQAIKLDWTLRITFFGSLYYDN